MKHAAWLFTFCLSFSAAQALEMSDTYITPYKTEWILWADCEASYSYLQYARKHERHEKRIKSARNKAVNLAANDEVVRPSQQVQSTVDYRMHLYKRAARKKSLYNATFKANQHIDDYCKNNRNQGALL
jgi:hypothetical protein